MYFHEVDMESFVFSTISESISMHLPPKSHNVEPSLEVGESFMKKDLSISNVFDNAFPSDSIVIEPIIPTDLGVTKNSSFHVAFDIPKTIRENNLFQAMKLP